MASTGLSKTFSGAGTNNKKGTISFWMKKTKLGAAQVGLTTAGASGGNAGLQFGSDDRLDMYLAYDGSWRGIFETTRVFRDTSAWYHIVVAWDTTQATDTNRLKFYVNGVQETSFVSITYPPQDQVTTFGNAQAHYINYWSNSNYFDGLMTHIHYTDGYTYAASDFGSTDSTTGEWKINTSPSVTYGTNGFFILKDGNSVTDQSGNSNNFTVSSGTLTQTEDCPSNNFATLNPLFYTTSDTTLSNGNNTTTTTQSTNRCAFGTLAPSSGKYYWEIKILNDNDCKVGIVDLSHTYNLNAQALDFSASSQGYSYDEAGTKTTNGSNASYGTNYNANDIIGVAMDLDNNKLYFSLNGTWQNSGNPESGATGTGSAFTIASGGTYAPAVKVTSNCKVEFNFGNGFFGTTAISSEGTNASGIGKFEYDVPTGYTALSTKGLNE